MPACTRSAYAPLPSTIPAVLAPSSPLPPSFKSDVQHWSHALADADRLRRLTGLRHAAPASLGLPQLVSTGVSARWGNGDDDSHDQAPPWVLAVAPRSRDDRKRDKAERRAWDQLGVAGIPRDEVEAAEWDLVKRNWRAKAYADKAPKVGKVNKVKPPQSSGDSKASAPVLSAHFPSSKSSVAASSGSKKRPPSSPPATHSPSSPPGPRSIDAAKPVAPSKDRPAHSASFPSLSSINSAGRAVASPAPRRTCSARELAQDVEDGVLSDGEGDGDEVLYERGCTQMVLPDPTPSAAVGPSSRLPRTSAASAASSVAAPAAAPFSSPGLRHSASIPGAGIAISTPHALSRAPSRGAAHLPSPSASPRPSYSHARSPSPPNTVKAPAPRHPAPPSRATTAVSSLSVPLGPAPPGAHSALHRLSSIARTASAMSGRSAAAEGEEGAWEGFLEEDAQD
ncbi:hypothetical protein JCM8208_003093 [Rhodotorula glutinis]